MAHMPGEWLWPALKFVLKTQLARPVDYGADPPCFSCLERIYQYARSDLDGNNYFPQADI